MSDRAVFLDRDGLLNQKAPEGEYIATWDEIEILPGVREAVARLNEAGFRTFVVTNQRGIALGKVQLNALLNIHQRLATCFREAGAVIEAIYYCPHDLPLECACRKPEPGMLLRAAIEHKIDLRRSWMIGDSISDVEAGRRAGCRTVFISSRETICNAANLLARNLPDAVEKILHQPAVE